MSRILVFSLILLAFGATQSLAQNYYYPYGNPPGMATPYPFPTWSAPGRQAQPPVVREKRGQGPTGIIRGGLAKLRAFQARGGASGGAAVRFVETEIAPHFDFGYMAKWAAGPAWRHLNKDRRRQAKAMVREHFLKSLIGHMGDFRMNRVTVSRARRGQSRGERVVPVTVQNRRGASTSLRFRFYRSKKGWKIFDVSANGRSAVVFYRGYFRRKLSGIR